jgi:S-adenosylmethionine/arginine decarboxylase-like enzyme
MNVRKGLSFAQKVLAEKRLVKPFIQHHHNNGKLPSVALIMKERQLLMSWMNSHRNEIAAKLTTPATVKLTDQDRFLGSHWLAEIAIPEAMKQKLFNNENPIQTVAEIIHSAATIAQATILNQISFQQEHTQNITSILVISESHLSINVIPAENLVIVDVFTCGEIGYDEAIDYIRARLGGEVIARLEVVRGLIIQNKFLPGIGVKTNDTVEMLADGRNTSNKLALGRHVLIELYLCDSYTINDAAWVRSVFQQAIKVAGGKLEGDFVHVFTPQGVSNVAIGSAKQAYGNGYCVLTIHDYPEYSVEDAGAYATVDFCDLTGELDFDLLIDFIQKSLQSAKIFTHEFLRGVYEVGADNKKEFVKRLEFEASPVAEETRMVLRRLSY